MTCPFSCSERYANNLAPPPPTVFVKWSGLDWGVSVNPIVLNNDADRVTWDLTEVESAYSGATFQIKFTSYCPHPWVTMPGPFETLKGPFSETIGPATTKTLSTTLNRNHNWGCYLYEIWIYPVTGCPVKLNTFADPQVDNLMPPPHAPDGGEDS